MSLSARVLELGSLEAGARAEAVALAARTIRGGGLAVIPTETVYGLATSGGAPESAARARRLAGLAPGTPLAWHAREVEAVLGAAPRTSPLHRRALQRLAPGPVTFVIEMDAAAMALARKEATLAPGVSDDGGSLYVRIPADATAASVIVAAGASVVAAGVGSGGEPPSADWLSGKAGEGEVVMLRDGPTRYRKHSTVVHLALDGGVALLREGALEERYVSKRLSRVVLFVCTGNTCRSPMAAALANAEAARLSGQPGSVPTRAISAGLGAIAGAMLTPEARRSLERMGVAAGYHSSRALTREAMHEADAIFGMTPEHVAGALLIAPEAAGKVATLDPTGEPIEDPVGMDQTVYDATAARLRSLVAERLRRLDD